MYWISWISKHHMPISMYLKYFGMIWYSYIFSVYNVDLYLSIAILFKSIWQYKINKNYITCRGKINVYIVGLRRWNADTVMLVLHISIYLYAFIAIYGSDLKWNAFFAWAAYIILVVSKIGIQMICQLRVEESQNFHICILLFCQMPMK